MGVVEGKSLRIVCCYNAYVLLGYKYMDTIEDFLTIAIHTGQYIAHKYPKKIEYYTDTYETGPKAVCDVTGDELLQAFVSLRNNLCHFTNADIIRRDIQKIRGELEAREPHKNKCIARCMHLFKHGNWNAVADFLNGLEAYKSECDARCVNAGKYLDSVERKTKV